MAFEPRKMKIRKALITAGNPNQRSLPLQVLIDQQGESKPAIQFVLEEASGAGIEEFVVVVCPGDEDQYAVAAGRFRERVAFVPQSGHRGYGNAILHGKPHFNDEEGFLHLVGDHLYLSLEGDSCAKQLVAVAKQERASVSAVQATHERELPFFGAVGGRLVPGTRKLFQVESVVEKPSPTEAETKLLVPGQRVGHYLCFFGMHVLTPEIFAILEELSTKTDNDAPLSLSSALDLLATRQRYLALEVSGRRFDIGGDYGVLLAQLALTLSGRDREMILGQLVELLAKS
jgi:UTP--glucose-1-phosphate uridylyltransferase